MHVGTADRGYLTSQMIGGYLADSCSGC